MRAFLILELLLAMGVMSMTLTAVSLVTFGLPFMVQNAELRAGALILARSLMENATPLASTTDRAYVKSLTLFDAEDEDFLEIRALVSWVNTFGVPQSLLLSQSMSTLTHSSACDPFISGDWNHPVLLGTYAVPGTISDITVASSTFLVTLASTSTATASTLRTYDIRDTNTLHLVEMFDNASTSRIGFSSVTTGENGIVFAGNAFTSGSAVTCSDQVSCAQVHIFKHTGQSSYVRTGTLILSTSTPPLAVNSNGQPAPTQTLTYYQQCLYVGLQKTANGSEFNIIDARDPTHLVWRSGYQVGRTINSIIVRGSHAFLSTDDPSREFIILDIHDPDHPVFAGSFDAPGSTSFGYGAVSTVHEPYVRFGRSYVSNAAEFEILDIQDLAHIKEIQRKDTGTVRDPESVRGMLTQDALTYVLLTHRLEFLHTRDPGKLTPYAEPYTLPIGSEGVSLSCRNNLIYVGRNSENGFGYIDILTGS